MIALNNREICIEDNTLNNKNKYVFQIASFVFDYENMILMRKGNFCRLTCKETDLLKLLCVNKNSVLTREFILKTIWRNDDYFLGRSMDVYISKLRKYLKFDKNISIVTIHGIGFKLRIEENNKIK